MARSFGSDRVATDLGGLSERFEAQLKTPRGRAQLGMPERWILSRLQATATAVDVALEAYRFADAANAIYIYGHWPVIIVAGVLLYRHRRHRYYQLRNACLLSGLVGLVIEVAVQRRDCAVELLGQSVPVEDQRAGA